MSVDRAELADALAEATGWSVTTDPHRVTFTNDDPPQVVIWTVTDSELGLAHRNTTSGIVKFYDHYQLFDVLNDCGLSMFTKSINTSLSVRNHQPERSSAPW